MKNNEISLQMVFRSLFRHLPIILAAMILFGVGSWAYTRFAVKPTYIASAKMIAISNTERTGGDNYTTAEHNAAVMLVNTTAEVINTNAILEKVAERLEESGLHYTPTQLKGMIGISSQNETEVFTVQAKGTSRRELPLIANTVCDIAEQNVGEIMKAGSTKVLEYATNAKLSGPSIMRNTVLGVLIGLVLAALYVILRDINDTTIWTEDDLTEHFDVPLLGMVPQLNLTEPSAKSKE